MEKGMKDIVKETMDSNRKIDRDLDRQGKRVLEGNKKLIKQTGY